MLGKRPLDGISRLAPPVRFFNKNKVHNQDEHLLIATNDITFQHDKTKNETKNETKNDNEMTLVVRDMNRENEGTVSTFSSTKQALTLTQSLNPATITIEILPHRGSARTTLHNPSDQPAKVTLTTAKQGILALQSITTGHTNAQTEITIPAFGSAQVQFQVRAHGKGKCTVQWGKYRHEIIVIRPNTPGVVKKEHKSTEQLEKERQAARREMMQKENPHKQKEYEWIVRQEQGFVQWLNFYLKPDAKNISNDDDDDESSGLQEIYMRFRSDDAYSEIRRFYHEQQLLLYNRIDSAIDQKRLIAREDGIHHIIQVQHSLAQLLGKYNPKWLAAAVDIVLDRPATGKKPDVKTLLHDLLNIAPEHADILAPQQNTLLVAATSSQRAADRASAFGQRVTAPLVIKRFLRIFHLMDSCKIDRKLKRVWPGEPLFLSAFSSSDVLRQFATIFMLGDASAKQLHYLNFELHFVQSEIDSIDFRIKSLSTDLRDGTRLAKLAEVLTGHQCLLNMRLPADNDVKRIHNVKVAMDCLSSFDLLPSQENILKSAAIVPHDIVYADQAKTLSLIWNIILSHDATVPMNVDLLHSEVERIQKQNRKSFPMLEPLLTGTQTDSLLLWMQAISWAQAESSEQQLVVQNMSTTLRSGTMLCLIMNYYHPSMLPKDTILRVSKTKRRRWNETSAHMVSHEEQSSFKLGMSFATLTEKRTTPEEVASKENFERFNEAVSQLGGVPLMLKSADALDDRVTSAFLMILAMRIVAISPQIHACIRIQRALRRHWRRKQHDANRQEIMQKLLHEAEERRVSFERGEQMANDLRKEYEDQQHRLSTHSKTSTASISMNTDRSLPESDLQLQAQRFLEECEQERLENKRMQQLAAEEQQRQLNAFLLMKEQWQQQHDLEEQRILEQRLEANRLEEERRTNEENEHQRRLAERQAQLQHEFDVKQAELEMAQQLAAEQRKLAEEADRQAAEQQLLLEEQRLKNQQLAEYNAATILQKYARGFLAHRKLRRLRADYWARLDAAITCQRFYRGTRARRFFRDWRELKQIEAATNIFQRHWRSKMQRRRTIASTMQQALAKKQQKASVVIQCAIRVWLACRVRKALEKQKAEEVAFQIIQLRTYAAAIIQRAYRNRKFRTQQLAILRALRDKRLKAEEAKRQELLRIEAERAAMQQERLKAEEAKRQELLQIEAERAAMQQERLKAEEAKRQELLRIEAERAAMQQERLKAEEAKRQELLRIEAERAAMQQERLKAEEAKRQELLQIEAERTAIQEELNRIRRQFEKEQHERQQIELVVQQERLAADMLRKEEIQARMCAEQKAAEERKRAEIQMQRYQEELQAEIAGRELHYKQQMEQFAREKAERETQAHRAAEEHAQAAAENARRIAEEEAAMLKRKMDDEHRTREQAEIQAKLLADHERAIEREKRRAEAETAALMARLQKEQRIREEAEHAAFERQVRIERETQQAIIAAKQKADAAAALQAQMMREQQEREAEEIAKLEAQFAEEKAARQRREEHHRQKLALMQAKIQEEMTARNAVESQLRKEREQKLVEQQRAETQAAALRRELESAKEAERLMLMRRQQEAAQKMAIKRQNDSVLKLQSAFRAWKARDEANFRMWAIVKIQALWRGHRVRSRSKKKMQSIRSKLKNVTMQLDKHLSIGTRTKTALEILLSSKSLSVVTQSCVTLQTVTRLLPVCCHDAVDQGAVHTLFELIKKCNRSQPHLTLVESALAVLRNVAVNPTTTKDVLSYVNFLDVLSEQLQFSKESSSIFLLTVELIALSIHHQYIARNNPIGKKLIGCYNVLSSKLAADEKMARRGATPSILSNKIRLCIERLQPLITFFC